MPLHVFLPPLTLTPLSDLDSYKPVNFYSVPTACQTLSSQELHPTPNSISAPASREPASLAPRPQTQECPPPASDRRRSKRLRPSTSARGAVTHTQEISESYSHLSSLNSVSLSGRSAPSQSLANIPTWAIPLPKLTQLPALLAPSHDGRRRSSRGRGETEAGARQRVSVLCCVMSAEAPVRRQRRKPGPRGRMDDIWIATWRVSAPGTRGESLPDPVSCDVKMWDECARDWGGGVKKGDVVLLEDVEYQPASVATNQGPQLVLSPASKPRKPIILYRTMPRYAARRSDYEYRAGPRGAEPHGQRGEMNPEDHALRPDLRLARSDPGVQTVARLAEWCAEWVGGEGP